ncbi:MAG TPA: hypothetical protein VM933_00505 [Acidimicrobiales bacterium]|nr:hypothetical protein [Acidimicrobiales bacterium]
MARRLAPSVAWVIAIFWIGNGMWAFLAPQSFYDQLATFPPYNVHFIHDIGAFSIGLGAVIAFARLGWTALRSALVGVGVGSVVHVVSHVVDYDLKPSVSDIVGLSVFALVTLAAGLAVD